MWVWITTLYLPSSWLRDPQPSNDSIWLVCPVISEHTSTCLQPKDVRDRDTPNFQNSANALGAYSLAAAVVQLWGTLSGVLGEANRGSLVLTGNQASINALANQTQSPFLLHEQPTTSLARPPCVVQSTLPQYSHTTAVWECEKTVEISLHCLQITSIKKELGACTSLLSLCICSSWVGSAFKRSISIVLFEVWANIYLIIKPTFQLA